MQVKQICKTNNQHSGLAAEHDGTMQDWLLMGERYPRPNDIVSCLVYRVIMCLTSPQSSEVGDRWYACCISGSDRRLQLTRWYVDIGSSSVVDSSSGTSSTLYIVVGLKIWLKFGVIETEKASERKPPML